MIIFTLLQIPLGLIYGNAMEWLIHRYILHGLGKDKTSYWAFHWHNHHKNARRANMVDEDYIGPMKKGSPPDKELWSLIGASLAHGPLLLVAPVFTLTVWYCAINYYRVHKKSHLDPDWAREYLPWHVDHHMGPNQDMNWCVTRPWFDLVMGTREKFVGTKLEEQAILKRRRLEQRRAANHSSSESAA